MSDLRMPNTNVVIVAGRIVRDPEVKSTNSGKSVCDFTVVNETGYGENAKPNWIGVVAWQETAKYVGSLSKGRAVIVQGRIETETYERKDGTKQTKTRVIAHRVESLDWPEKNGDGSGRRQMEEPIPEDDIPF